MVKSDFSENLATPKPGIDEIKPPRVFIDVEGARRNTIGFALVAVVIVGLLGLFLGTLEAKEIPDMSEGKLFAFAVLCSAAGAAIHAITSFVTFAGNRELVQSWIWWLYMRVPIGVLLGILVYFALRSGSLIGLETDKTLSVKSFYFIGIVTALSGLFSKQVTDKLSDVVENLIVPAKRPGRIDALKEKVAKDTPQAPAEAPDDSAPDTTIFSVQTMLIKLGHLSPQTSAGEASDDGVLGDETRAAIESFLKAQGLTGDDLAALLGEEDDADYWTNLEALLEDTLEAGP